MEESSLPVCMKFGAACRPETEEPSMKEPALASSSRLGGAVISDRVVASLLEELTNGRYAQADRLPAEVDLATELGVSRTVIRDALSEMERAGYVERVRGIGTVVNRAVLGAAQPPGPEAGVLPADPQLWQLPPCRWHSGDASSCRRGDGPRAGAGSW